MTSGPSLTGSQGTVYFPTGASGPASPRAPSLSSAMSGVLLAVLRSPRLLSRTTVQGTAGAPGNSARTPARQALPGTRAERSSGARPPSAPGEGHGDRGDGRPVADVGPQHQLSRVSGRRAPRILPGRDTVSQGEQTRGGGGRRARGASGRGEAGGGRRLLVEGVGGLQGHCSASERRRHPCGPLRRSATPTATSRKASGCHLPFPGTVPPGQQVTLCGHCPTCVCPSTSPSANGQGLGQQSSQERPTRIAGPQTSEVLRKRSSSSHQSPTAHGNEVPGGTAWSHARAGLAVRGPSLQGRSAECTRFIPRWTRKGPGGAGKFHSTG